MMEALIGPLPHWMKSHSPLRRTYFQADLQLRANELGEKSRKKVLGLSTATLAAFQPDLGTRHEAATIADIPGEGFLELLQGLLQLDPRERLLPRQAVDAQFFRSLSNLPGASCETALLTG